MEKPSVKKKPVGETKFCAGLGKIIAVMPAYNAQHTLARTIADIPAGIVDEIILVDDASTDNTVDIARKSGLTVITHSENRGYGANQKTCYRTALDHGAGAVVMIHPDYQYDARVIPLALGFLSAGICDIVIGSRIRSRKEALKSGMPLYKYIANRILTIIENMITGRNLGDFHSGFRVYTRKVLQTIPFDQNSDDFVFDSEFLAQAVYFDFTIGDIPIPSKYFSEASSINFKKSVKYGVLTLYVMLKFLLQKWGLAKFRIFSKAKR